MTATTKFTRGMANLASDIAQGFFEITQNGFALLGLAVMFAVITLTVRPEIRQAGEVQLMSWLQSRQSISTGVVPDLEAVDRATATNPQDLPKPQAAVAYWLSKKYNVAPEPIGALVAEAFETGGKAKLEPTLILAVMAVESGFNPFAQSSVGAQGLMQVMTHIHRDKYQGFGGKLAAFDPISNLRVGIKVLQDCVARAGSVEGGLKLYVGAGNMEDDGGYTAKVLAEHNRLRQVSNGRTVPFTQAPVVPTVAAPPAKPTPALDEQLASLTP